MKKLKSQLNEPEIIKNLFEKLISSEHHVFPARGKINITEKHGVYIIYNPKNEVLHVGIHQVEERGLIKDYIITFHVLEYFMRNT